jgi:hypothetical protein
MNRFGIAGALSLALATSAFAQQPPPVTIPGTLMQAVVNHLMVGGTISDGQHLAQQVVEAAQAPARAEAEEKAIRAKIAAEAKPTTPTPTLAPTPAPTVP